ncbi:hypothetical protein B4U79_08415 [Dinothrombium tinctorium]|uniref:Malonyl-CoA:ACP transacylase (MAT) domain-containing protein n=1 Tax=Dinothrombium tinctorium TaxID=1965070 RepID=A0A443QTQ2_9ACAR|nr:hypothetical protein B4U79_08415 [Dinothrombium tinctorium]
MIMFCGQGAQKEDMLQTLVNDPSAKEFLDVARKVTGVDILEQCKNSESLKKTSFVQIALFVGSVSKLKQIESNESQLLRNVKAVAGLSVGEFAALTYAGVLTFEDALKIVEQRGIAMQRLVDKFPTAMASVLGASTQQLSDFLTCHFPNLKISGYLADNQHTVGGEYRIIDEFIQKLNDKDVVETLNLINVRKLRVSGGFHTNFMQKAAQDIEQLIESIEFKQPKIPVIFNVTGKVENDPQVIKALLKEQLTSPLQWKQTILTAVQMGIRNFIEISPSPILSAIIRKRIQECADQKCVAQFHRI